MHNNKLTQDEIFEIMGYCWNKKIPLTCEKDYFIIKESYEFSIYRLDKAKQQLSKVIKKTFINQLNQLEKAINKLSRILNAKSKK